MKLRIDLAKQESKQARYFVEENACPNRDLNHDKNVAKDEPLFDKAYSNSHFM